jgi:GntP family gluconate:H+ symporter
MHPIWILLIAVAIVLGGILLLRLQAFVALILAALTVAMLTPVEALEKYAKEQVEDGSWSPKAAEGFVRSTAPERVATAFGRTCGSIGILIAMAAIIGKCMLESGAADKIVRWALRLVGEARAGIAFLGSGFLLGIPVFFDTVFYLMIPLAKAMRLRTGANYLLYVLAITAGGTMAHSLVPPTPGPLYVADQLGVNLGVMIVVGCLIGMVTCTAGYAFARWANRRWEVPLRESDDVSLAELKTLARCDERELPPVWLSLLPILLPVVLITSHAGLDAYLDTAGRSNVAAGILVAERCLATLGNKNLALVLAAAVAFGTLAWRKKASRPELARSVQTALGSGGVIVLITAGGGAFGSTMRECGVADQIALLADNLSPIWILPVAFVVTTLVRTAQGSATVSMITAVGVLQQFAQSGILNFHPVYLAMAIGCGSKPLSWMNDSGFWVICRMSGMTEAETLRTVTPMTAIMGVTGLVATMLAAWLVPLV